MKTLSAYRHRVADWLQLAHEVFEDRWLAAREDLGQRVAKSKRREIAELRELADSTRRDLLVLTAKFQLMEANAELDAAFNKIRRREEPGW